MKKIISIILSAALMLLVLTACKDDNKQGTPPSSTNSSPVGENPAGGSEPTQPITEGAGFETDEDGTVHLPEIPW